MVLVQEGRRGGKVGQREEVGWSTLAGGLVSKLVEEFERVREVKGRPELGGKGVSKVHKSLPTEKMPAVLSALIASRGGWALRV